MLPDLADDIVEPVANVCYSFGFKENPLEQRTVWLLFHLDKFANAKSFQASSSLSVNRMSLPVV